jgi:hypothetical protein
MTICHMPIACYIPKPASTHSEYAIRIAFPLQQWLHERASNYVIRTVQPVLLLYSTVQPVLLLYSTVQPVLLLYSTVQPVTVEFYGLLSVR